MFSLTGQPLLVLAVVVGVLAMAAVVFLVAFRPAFGLRHRVWTRVLPVTALVLVAQLCAVLVVALAVNDNYGFYTSWGDLRGTTQVGTSAIATGGLLSKGEGSLRVMTVHDQRVGSDDRVLVWLPKQYALPQYSRRKFPVVMFMPGQPSGPQIVFREFHFGSTASQLIDNGTVQPFIGVFPTLMVSPPRDTECTNVRHGPQAFTWLAKDVPAFVTQHFRARPLGRDWSVMGWSTGGFCASKLITTYQPDFSRAVSFGGYYEPLQDHTTGHLFHGSLRAWRRNNPQWLYLHRGLRGDKLLMVVGRQDKGSWPSTSKMIGAALGDPEVSHITFPVGGHNYRNYSAYLSSALRWAATAWRA